MFRALLILLALVCTSWVAEASPVVHVHSEIGYSCAADDRRYHGGLIGAGARATLNDVFQLGVRYQLSEHRSKGEAFTVHHAALGGVIVLDVFHYVPWVGVYLGPSWSNGHPSMESPDFGYSYDLGFDRLLDRDWSIGALIQFHAASSMDRVPSFMQGGVRVEYRFQTGDPFDE